jgi:hypothetical protein
LSSGCLCFCSREAQSTTNQTIAQGGGGSYVMVDTCFFGLTKNKDKKKIGKLTAYFASSQFFHHLTGYNIVVGNYFLSCDLLIFLALSETMYLLAPPTITCIPDLTEEFSVCTSGTLRRKG